MQMTKNYAVLLVGSCVACFLIGMSLGGFFLGGGDSGDGGDDVQKVQIVRSPEQKQQDRIVEKRSMRNAAKAMISAFETALDVYAMDTSDYPTTEQGLQALVEPPNATIAEQWQGPYLSRDVPLDPWDNAYRYEYHPMDGENTKPEIASAGPDGDFGTEDDITEGESMW